MHTWKVEGKRAVPHERGDGIYFTLDCVNEEGRKRQAIVTRNTWEEAKIGEPVALTD